jgi:hypothetical protein
MGREARRVRCYGGPADGASVGQDGQVFRFIGGGLYRYLDDAYHYCGADAWRCGCGAYLVPRERHGPAAARCPLCGGSRRGAGVG